MLKLFRFAPLTFAFAIVSLMSGTLPAQQNLEESARVSIPLIIGWYDGHPAPYLQTDTSDLALAQQMSANFSPALGNAANTSAVDDIYLITNYKQGNVIPSAPIPAGPGNTNASYTPLWQVSMVTWNSSAKPRLLTSEDAIRTAESAGELTVVKSNIVVNCPVMYTQAGGLFPGARFHEVK